MKCSRRVRAILPAAIFVFFSALIFLTRANAQEISYARMVRLSRVEGEIAILHSGSDISEPVQVNLPLREGDTLFSRNGLAQIEFENGAMAYLAQDSTLQFTRLELIDGGRITELTITQGTGTFYANLASRDTFRVSTLTFDVSIPERAEFRIDTFSDGAAAQVSTGNVAVSTKTGSTTLDKGQSIAIHLQDFEHRTVQRLPFPDSFDQWVSNEIATAQAGAIGPFNYTNSRAQDSQSAYAENNISVSCPGYGYAWRPFGAASSWQPYVANTWSVDPSLGFFWASNEPGAASLNQPGSWLLCPSAGWTSFPGGYSGLNLRQPPRANPVGLTGFGNPIGKSGAGSNGVVASPRVPGSPHSIIPSIVYDPKTRSYINSNQSPRNNEVISPLVLMPPSSSQSSNPEGFHTPDHVLMPPSAMRSESRTNATVPFSHVNPPHFAQQGQNVGVSQSLPDRQPRQPNPPSTPSRPPSSGTSSVGDRPRLGSVLRPQTQPPANPSTQHQHR